ncbi:hypothetical protein NMG60_11020594 [Bertholletia excelsa]
MKYLEYTPLDSINDFLSLVNLGERTIKGCLEAYSCKHTGTDKKLSLSLQQEILDYLGKSLDTDSSSPVEYLCTNESSRKTLVYLILTLYHMYPDYDFSAVKAHQFFTEESWESFKQIFDAYMFEASKEWTEVNEGSPLLDTLYKALDEIVKLAECEIYSYNPDSDADPFLTKGAIWSFTFFFYNRKLKRVVSFHFGCTRPQGGFPRRPALPRHLTMAPLASCVHHHPHHQKARAPLQLVHCCRNFRHCPLKEKDHAFTSPSRKSRDDDFAPWSSSKMINRKKSLRLNPLKCAVCLKRTTSGSTTKKGDMEKAPEISGETTKITYAALSCEKQKKCRRNEQRYYRCTEDLVAEGCSVVSF